MVSMYTYTFIWDDRGEVLNVHKWLGTLGSWWFFLFVFVELCRKVERPVLSCLFHTQQDMGNPTKASGKLG
jgi:hypothetical protein